MRSFRFSVPGHGLKFGDSLDDRRTVYTKRMMKEHGVDVDSGGSYEFPDGTVLHLRGRYGLDTFSGDVSAYISYIILRMREYDAIADKIRDHHSQVFASAFRKTIRSGAPT